LGSRTRISSSVQARSWSPLLRLHWRWVSDGSGDRTGLSQPGVVDERAATLCTRYSTPLPSRRLRRLYIILEVGADRIRRFRDGERKLTGSEIPMGLQL